MDYRDFNIDIRSSKTSGEVQCLCPQCSHTRKKKTDKCLSVNLDKQSWFCHHCAWAGGLVDNKKMDDVVYVKPAFKNNTFLSQKAVEWFEKRAISQATLNAFKITEGLEWMPQVNKEINTIQFNYFRNSELVNVKYRTGNKHFKLHKGSELIFYNLDVVANSKEIIICEGEMDALAFYEAGYKNVVSVPNGANINTNNLSYIDNCIELFNEAETIYLATDNDIAGRKLRQELGDRFGLERCRYIEFEEFKDCNDLLIHRGIIGVTEAFKGSKLFPLEGVFTIEDFDLEINDMYVNGLETGADTGMEDFDRLLKFAKGYITTITGIPGHGKSDFLDQLCLKLHLRHGWKFAFYSPENKPTRLHFSKLARKAIGKKWFGFDRITTEERDSVKNSLNNSFWFLKPEKDFTIDSILKLVKQLVKAHGIDAFIIDAWNKLEHQYTVSETKYIGETLDKIAMFCEENNVHCFLVAHPTKIYKDKATGFYEIPTMYNIAGSANFYNKSDNGICVYRNFETHMTDIYVQKVKFSHWGEIGRAEFRYALDSGRFELEDEVPYDWILDSTQRKDFKEKIDKPIPVGNMLDAFGEVYKEDSDVPF